MVVVVVLSLKNWVVVEVVVSYCTKKIGLMLLLGCVIKSNCGCCCGCGRSSQVDCVVVVVVVDHFSFCTSLVWFNKSPEYEEGGHLIHQECKSQRSQAGI